MSDSGDKIAGLDWVRLADRPPSPNGQTPRLRLVDLFCGCGGLTLGVSEAARLSNRQMDIRLAMDECPRRCRSTGPTSVPPQGLPFRTMLAGPLTAHWVLRSRQARSGGKGSRGRSTC